MQKQLRSLAVFLTLVVVALWVTVPAMAWETLVEKGKNSWLSLYQKHIDAEGVAEHTEFADIALNRLGVGKLFSRKGTADFRVVDLNASYYRFDAMSGLEKAGDNPDTPLEERLLPSPAYFSGVPDYSFTIYDWLNKNELCPPGAPAQTCHVYFGGWLGNLNSTHFGSQAEGMYDQFHGLAMFLARRASKFHRQIRNAGDKERDAYKAWVREAELEALAYEGYAQHFLQDRWSIGHMWERWNAGGYNQLPRKDMAVNMAIGAISGLIHGSEAVVGKVNKLGKKIGDYSNNLDALDIPGDSMAARLARQLKSMAGSTAAEVSRQFTMANPADPMSSPWIRDGEALPSVWRHAVTADRNLYYGIGDDRLADMKDKKFGKEYPQIGKDYDIDVERQFDEFMTCSMAGWAEVIREFGKYDGLYGAWGAKLADGAPAFDIRKRRACWDMWATNRSVFLGLTNHNSLNASVVSRLSWAVDVFTSIKKVINLDGFPRKDVARMVTETELDMLDNPAGTDLASGGLRSILGVGTGDEYNHTPAYAETPMFNKFELLAANGMDKATIYGVFNRAHSDQLCKDIPKILKELRGEEGSRKLALCEYLGNFAYESTSRDYNGTQKEHRQYKDTKIKGLCAIRGKGLSTRDTMPRFIDQGYVPYGEYGKPRDRSESGMGPQSIWNWCREMPILLLAEKPELRDDNIVAEIDPDEKFLSLKGENLGDLEGRILALKDGKWVSLGHLQQWQENYIVIKLDLDDSWQDDKDYRLKIIAHDARESPGLLRLRIKKKKITPKPIQLIGVGPCRIPLNIEKIPVVDFTEAIAGWDELTPARMTRLNEAAEPFWTMAADLMEREAECIDADRIKVVDPKYDRLNRKPVFPDAGGYPSIIVKIRERKSPMMVGQKLLQAEIHHSTVNWNLMDRLFYDRHSRILHAMADYFRQRPDKLQELTDHAQDLLDKVRDSANDNQREEDAKAYRDYRQKIYEDIYRDYTLAPRYLAYLGTGLNRWAMAEQRLTSKIIPATERARQSRKASLLVEGCSGAFPDGQFLQYPVSLAAQTPAFSMMYYDLKSAVNDGSLLPASDDRPDIFWRTPGRQQQQQGWSTVIDVRSIDLSQSSCASNTQAISAAQQMSNFEFLYGSQYDDLMGMGALYNQLYRKDEGRWVGEKEEKFTCLRCAAIERAINVYKAKMTAYSSLPDQVMPFAQGAMGTRGPAVASFIRTRITQLEKQLAGCRQRCEVTDIAMPDSKVLSPQELLDKYYTPGQKKPPPASLPNPDMEPKPDLGQIPVLPPPQP